MSAPARLGQLVLAPELESSATDMRARGHLNAGGRDTEARGAVSQQELVDGPVWFVLEFLAHTSQRKEFYS